MLVHAAHAAPVHHEFLRHIVDQGSEFDEEVAAFPATSAGRNINRHTRRQHPQSLASSAAEDDKFRVGPQ